VTDGGEAELAAALAQRIASLELEAQAQAEAEEEEARLAAEREAFRKQRKQAKKLRRSGAGDAAAEVSGAVLPREPPAGEITGDRRACSLDAFVPVCKLGEGGFGRVHLVRWRGDGAACAMKVVLLSEALSASMAPQLLAERAVL